VHEAALRPLRPQEALPHACAVPGRLLNTPATDHVETGRSLWRPQYNQPATQPTARDTEPQMSGCKQHGRTPDDNLCYLGCGRMHAMVSQCPQSSRAQKPCTNLTRMLPIARATKHAMHLLRNWVLCAAFRLVAGALMAQHPPRLLEAGSPFVGCPDAGCSHSSVPSSIAK
jgi:hypothetical protein